MHRQSRTQAGAANVVRPGDRNRVRLGLARMRWIEAMTEAERRSVVDALAAALLPAIIFARVGVPPVQPRQKKTVGRKNKPGGGKPPKLAAHVLASDVKRTLQDVGVYPGRWRFAGKNAADGEMNSVLLDVQALCWEMATEAPGKPGRKLRDPRRMGAGPNGWHLIPTRLPTAAEQQRLSNEAAAAAVERQRWSSTGEGAE